MPRPHLCINKSIVILIYYQGDKHCNWKYFCLSGLMGSHQIWVILRASAAPYTAILLCDRILLNRHVILHYTIPKPYIHWKGMLLSSFTQPSLMPSQDHDLSVYIGFGMLRPRINGLFNQFWSEGKIACQGGVGGLKRNDG